MDPNNPVVRLCVAGMQAEAAGDPTRASTLFHEAWTTATDDYEACIAAHYLARHQHTPEDVLHWNEECLSRADKVADERVQGFYPSLHLNIAKAHQDLNNDDKATHHYQAAAEQVHNLPPGPYTDGIRFAIAEGLNKANNPNQTEPPDLALLLEKLCQRTALKPLGLLLPAYLGNLGTTEDQTKLLTAAQMLHASRSLPPDEQELLARTITTLTATLAATVQKQ